MNSYFTIVDSFKCGNDFIADIHDFELLPNGNAVIIAYNPVNTGSSIVEDNIIQVLNKDKEVIFQWRALDHFTVRDATHEDTSAYAIDFAHINSIQSDTDDNIIASFRHLDEVTKIDHISGDILWHWGGKHNQFTFVGDTLQFSHQHHARRIGNGHITMFDNGNYHSTMFEEEPIVAPSSRAIEYDLDEINHTATVKWQYKNIPYSNAAGSVQRLANGNTFIGTGNLSSPCALEVTAKGNIVFQLSLPPQTVSYRAYRFDWTPAAVRSENFTHDLRFHSIYPNPASNETTIDFFVGTTGNAIIEIIDALGRIFLSLPQLISEAGDYSYNINVRDLPSGLYYCRLSQNGVAVLSTVMVQK